MKQNRRTFVRAAAAAAAVPVIPSAQAQDAKLIKLGMCQDFTVVYTFVTAEYSQGQRDYFTMINERGGIKGFKFQLDIVDTGNATQRGIEAYERFKREGVVLVDPLSTPVSRALVPRALADKINLVTTFSGRSDAADGEAFPYVMPLSPSYWSQAAVLVDYMRKQEKGLKGKKVALVHIDTPFGREPITLLQVLAKRHDFEFQTFPYPPPGTEQSAVWTQVRRLKPDWVMIWGAGAGQIASLKEAARNGIPMDRIASVVWMSESEMNVVGVDAAKGVLKFEGVAGGREPKIIQAIQNEVVAKGKGVGKPEIVGTTYYNIGVMAAALIAEGARLAIDKNPKGPITSEQLNEGLRSIKNFTAEGMLPPVTITKADHQGGGRGRVAQWDGKRWVPKSDWMAADQDVIWQMIRTSSSDFKKSGK
ncbi:MAG TPA: ABC transporter substrate-binding protein [Burkholderiaceae bacterium]|nr:ABC transporter substrate-binding protein [Burkholderiaceae bacterium]